MMSRQPSGERYKKRFSFNGQTKTVEEWASVVNVPVATLYYRLTHPRIWSVDKAMTTPYAPLVKGKYPLDLTLNGETKKLGEWAKELGLSYNTVHMRLARGHTTEEVLNPNLESDGQFKPTVITYKGESHSLSDWSRITGLDVSTIASRFYAGWSLDDVFSLDVSERDLMRLTVDGVTKTLQEWSKDTGIPVSRLRSRIALKWDPRRVVSTERFKKGRKRKIYEYKGLKMSVYELAEISGIPANVLQSRLAGGWSLEKAMSTPVKFRGGNHKLPTNFIEPVPPPEEASSLMQQ